MQSKSESWKAKEHRLQLANDRLKRRTEELESKNRELSDQVKVLEQERAIWFLKKESTSSLRNAAPQTKSPLVVKSQTNSLRGCASEPYLPVSKRHIDPLAESDLGQLENQLNLPRHEEVHAYYPGISTSGWPLRKNFWRFDKVNLAPKWDHEMHLS